MNTKILGIVIGLVVLVGLSSTLFSNKGASQGTGPITIGFIAPLTGDAASLGTVEKAAVEIAADEINASGGINGRELRVVYEDGKCAARDATSAATKLITQDKVTAIIGGLCSTETAAFGPFAMQNKVLIVSPGSSAPNLSQLGKYFFRDYPSDAFQGKFAAEYAYDKLGARKIAVLYHVSDYGTGIKNVFVQEFTKLGGEILAEEGAEQAATDYRTQLSKIKSARPDYIYVPLYPAGATAMFKQARELGITAKFLGGDALSDIKLHDDIKTLGLDILFTQLQTVPTEEFNKKVIAKTGGEEVPVYAATAYDAMYVLANALKVAGTDPDALAETIRGEQYDGVTGRIAFDENGDVTRAGYSVYRIANGSAAEVK